MIFLVTIIIIIVFSSKQFHLRIFNNDLIKRFKIIWFHKIIRIKKNSIITIGLLQSIISCSTSFFVLFAGVFYSWFVAVFFIKHLFNILGTSIVYDNDFEGGIILSKYS